MSLNQITRIHTACNTFADLAAMVLRGWTPTFRHLADPKENADIEHLADEVNEVLRNAGQTRRVFWA